MQEAGGLFAREPTSIQTEDTLAEAKAKLEKLKPDKKYETEWQQTRAVQNWKHWSQEIHALDAAVIGLWERLAADERCALLCFDAGEVLSGQR